MTTPQQHKLALWRIKMSKYDGRRVSHETFGKATLKFYPSEGMYLVIHDEPHPNLHSGMGNGPPDHCWWASVTRLTAYWSPYTFLEEYEEVATGKYSHVIAKMKQRQAKRKEEGYVF